MTRVRRRTDSVTWYHVLCFQLNLSTKDMNQTRNSHGFDALSAFSITVIYAVVSGGWIAFSDRLLAVLVADQELYTQLQTGKGWAFVAASSLLIYVLMSRREAELAEQNSQVEQRCSRSRSYTGFSATIYGTPATSSKDTSNYWRTTKCYPMTRKSKSSRRTSTA